jgi:nucleoside-diphosphate-sugar epimerase
LLSQTLDVLSRHLLAHSLTQSVVRVLQQGHEVTVLDNFFTGRKQNIEHWIGHPNFRLVMHDVVDPFMMEVCNRTPFKNVPPPLRPTPAYIVHSLLLPAHHC